MLGFGGPSVSRRAPSQRANDVLAQLPYGELGHLYRLRCCAFIDIKNIHTPFIPGNPGGPRHCAGRASHLDRVRPLAGAAIGGRGQRMSIPFVKMHGLGNDFVVLDARARPLDWSEEGYRRVADRRTGIGCDQFMVLRPPAADGDVFMEIRNADGGEVEACGNGTRCVAALLFDERGRDDAAVETVAGTLRAARGPDGLVRVDMGPARLAWDEIPLARPADTLGLDLAHGPLERPTATNIGNPHATFFVEDAEAVDLECWGPRVEHDLSFPERANVGVAEMQGRDAMRLRVWERGVGVTRACGTGACAAVAAAVRRGLGARRMEVRLDGGALGIEWRESDGHLLMTGPAAVSFRGELEAHVPEAGP